MKNNVGPWGVIFKVFLLRFSLSCYDKLDIERDGHMRIGMRTVKTAIAATLAIILAEWLHLEYAVSAGIIAILSVQNTKKGSLQLAIQRVYSTVLALSIAAVFFMLIGYNAVSFGLYLLIFIPLAVKLHVADGIVVSSVLVSHILLEQSLSFFWFKNELLLMAVGAGIAIILNLYMPKMEDEIKRRSTKNRSDYAPNFNGDDARTSKSIGIS